MSFGGMFDGAGSGVFSYDAGGGGGGGGGGGVHNSRLLPAPPVPKPGGGYAAPGLSLGLQTNMDGGHLGDMNRSLAMMGNGGSGSGGDGDSLGRGREDENDSRSGSDNLDGASGDDLDPDNSNPRKKKKRYHRHTPQQIQELECVQGVPPPRREAKDGAQPAAQPREPAGQVLVPESPHPDEDADRAARERAAAAGERQAEGGEHDDPRGDAEPHVRQLRRRGGARRGVAGGAAPAHRERTAEGRARPRLRARRQVPRPANLEHLLAQSAVAAGVLRPRARRRKQWVRARRPRGLGVAVHPRPDGWLRRPARGLCCHAPPRGHWRPRRRHARRGGRRRRHRPRRAPRARPRGHGRARQGCADGRAALAPQPRRRVRGAKLRRVPPRVRQGARPEPRQLRLRGHPRVRHRHHQQRRPRRQPHGRASLVGDVPVHRGEGEHDGHHLQRHGRHAQRVNSTDARGAAGAVAAGADPGGGLPPFLQAARRGPLGRRRRVGRRRPPPRPERRRRRRRFLLVVVHGLPPPPHRLHRAGHEQWLLQGHVGGSRGVRRDGGAPALPAAAPLRPGPRRPPLARLAPAPVPVPGHPLFQLPPRPRPRRDNAGGEEEHAEVGAADDGQLLRRGVRVGGAEVAAPGRVARRRGGRRRRRRGGQGAHDGAAQRGRARGAPRRRAERHHVGAPPRHAPAARVRLPPRRAAARRLGHPGQRRGHAGDGPHRQGPASRQCRLPPPSKCYEREPEQHADPPGDVHRFIGLPRRLRTGGRAIHARRHERRRLRLRLPPAVRLRHPPGRPQQRLAVPGRCRQRLAELHRGRRSHRRRQQQHRLAGDGGVPDPRQQSAHREAHRRVGRHRQQPPLLHHPEDQVRSAGQHHLAIDSGHLTWIPSRPVTKGSIRMPPQMSNLRG